MMKGVRAAGLAIALLLISTAAFALNEISIAQAVLKEDPPDRYIVSTTLTNRTVNPREVTIRAEIFIFDRVSPKGDRPVAVLRKDATVVLRARESRKVRVRLFDEGSVAKGRMRLESEVRLRRQRVWNY